MSEITLPPRLDPIDWIDAARCGPIVDIGQIPDKVRRKLDYLAKKGELKKWRGYWDSRHATAGIGPLKTWFGPKGYFHG